MDNKNLYEILGIDRDADQVAIKRAYRNLAREHHPDTAASAADTDKFAEIREAYQTLSDQEMRRAYDKSLASGSLFSRKYERLKRPKSRDRKDTTKKPGRARSSRVSSRILRTDELDEQPGESLKRSAKEQGPELGKKKEQAGRKTPISDGARERDSGIFDFIRKLKPGVATERAKNQRAGLPIVEINALESLRPCRKTVWLESGSGKRLQQTITIPAGVVDGTKLELQSLTDSRDEQLDLRKGVEVNVKVKPHPYVSREGDDIFLSLPLKPIEAFSGASVLIPTLEGAVSIQIPAHCDLNKRLRLKGKGLQKAGAESADRGDLYILPFIQLPDPKSPRQEARIRALLQESELRDFEPRNKMPESL